MTWTPSLLRLSPLILPFRSQAQLSLLMRLYIDTWFAAPIHLSKHSPIKNRLVSTWINKSSLRWRKGREISSLTKGLSDSAEFSLRHSRIRVNRPTGPSLKSMRDGEECAGANVKEKTPAFSVPFELTRNKRNDDGGCRSRDAAFGKLRLAGGARARAGKAPPLQGNREQRNNARR